VDVSQLLRGTLDAAALAVVAEQDGYGYDDFCRALTMLLETDAEVTA
jgi:hypothetical protein